MRRTSKAMRTWGSIVVLSLAVSWLTTLLQLAGPGRGRTEGTFNSPDVYGRHWLWSSSSGFGRQTVFRMNGTNYDDASATAGTPPVWSDACTAPKPQEEIPIVQVVEVASGWPFLSAVAVHRKVETLTSSRKIVVTTTWSTEWGVPVRTTGDRMPAAIPLRPIWRGVIGNAAVWTCVVGLAFWGAGRVRVARRRRRSQCVGCGYAVGGMERCPECGEEVGKGDLKS